MKVSEMVAAMERRIEKLKSKVELLEAENKEMARELAESRRQEERQPWKDREAAMLAMRREGVTYRQIAMKYDLSTARVTQIIKRAERIEEANRFHIEHVRAYREHQWRHRL